MTTVVISSNGTLRKLSAESQCRGLPTIRISGGRGLAARDVDMTANAEDQARPAEGKGQTGVTEGSLRYAQSEFALKSPGRPLTAKALSGTCHPLGTEVGRHPGRLGGGPLRGAVGGHGAVEGFAHQDLLVRQKLRAAAGR